MKALVVLRDIARLVENLNPLSLRRLTRHDLQRSAYAAFATAAFLSISCHVGTQPDPTGPPEVDLAKFPAASRAQVERYARRVADPPDVASANGELGMVLHAYSQFEAAEEAYQRAHFLEPVRFEWLYYLGIVQEARGRRAEAVQSLDKAVHLNPEAFSPALRLADVLAASENTSQSVARYRAIVQRHPDNPRGHYGLGMALMGAGDVSGAVAALQQACKLLPQYGAAHYGLGLAYRRLGSESAATRHFALSQDYRSGAPPTQDPWVDAVDRLNESPQAFLVRGTALEQSGKLREAAQANEDALERDPKLVIAHANLMSLYTRMNRIADADRHYEIARAINPDNPEVRINRGVLLLTQGRPGEAEEQFRAVLALNPQHTQAHKNLALLAERALKFDEALEHYRRASEIQPGDRVARFHAGRLLLRSRQYRDAVPHFLATLEPGAPNWPTFVGEIAKLYAANDRPDEAAHFVAAAKQQALAFRLTERVQALDEAFRFLNRVR